jgi:hypothetical protein
MMIVSSPRPPNIQEYIQKQRREHRLEMVIWSILSVQILEVIVLIALLVRR